MKKCNVGGDEVKEDKDDDLDNTGMLGMLSEFKQTLGKIFLPMHVMLSGYFQRGSSMLILYSTLFVKKSDEIIGQGF